MSKQNNSKNTPKRYLKRGGRKPPMRSKRDRQISIVFEDGDMLVASKPSGLLSVPIPKMESANLLESLNEELSVHNEKAITVHRIDRFTSGLVVFAKNSLAHKNLVKQFLSHTPKRTYLSLVRGVIPEEDGELIHYMKKITAGFRNVVVAPDDPEGAMARLTFKVLERHAETTLVQINLDTGLKNQIRVQFAEYGHPLVGDRHYAPAELEEEMIDRQALHSWKLELQHPRNGKTMEFESDLPSDLRRVIQFYKAK
jgi:23S rRNA pseudouridine1911/1915/1917 synthase